MNVTLANKLAPKLILSELFRFLNGAINNIPN